MIKYFCTMCKRYNTEGIHLHRIKKIGVNEIKIGWCKKCAGEARDVFGDIKKEIVEKFHKKNKEKLLP